MRHWLCSLKVTVVAEHMAQLPFHNLNLFPQDNPCFYLALVWLHTLFWHVIGSVNVLFSHLRIYSSGLPLFLRFSLFLPWLSIPIIILLWYQQNLLLGLLLDLLQQLGAELLCNYRILFFSLSLLLSGQQRFCKIFSFLLAWNVCYSFGTIGWLWPWCFWKRLRILGIHCWS